MRKITLLLLTCFTLTTHIVLSQAPPWTNYVHRKATFPEDEYLVGFMSENNLDEEPIDQLIDRLQGYSKDQLVESILVDVKSISTLNIHNVNANTHEEFKRNSTSVSTASIAGLKMETFYDKKKKIGYAFAYAKKQDVINHYRSELSRNYDQIATQFSMVQNLISSGDSKKALKSLLEMQTSLKNIEQDMTLLITLTGNYNHPAIKRDEVNEYKINIDSELNKIRSTDQNNIEDAAFAIAYSLKLQLDDSNAPIRVNFFTYQDTPMSSPFSRRLQTTLEQKLIQQGLKVAGQGYQGTDALVLTGTYWEETDKIKISTILRSQTESLAMGSAECYLKKSALEANQIGYKPENYEEALVSMKEFASNEITDGGLKVEVYTNKGKDNLIYTQGEEMRLFIKVNKECYLRFVYHLADGSKVLLLDDYYLSREYVNKAYQLPETFECAEPFGFETLQLNAQSEPFEPLATQEQYGYKFILDDNATVIQKTRGFKVSRQTETLKAESRLNITTMTK